MGDKKTSKQLLQEFTAKTYDEIREAKENGELIGWSTSNFPKRSVRRSTLRSCTPKTIVLRWQRKRAQFPFAKRQKDLVIQWTCARMLVLISALLSVRKTLVSGLMCQHLIFSVLATTSAQRLSSGTRISRTTLRFLFCSS